MNNDVLMKARWARRASWMWPAGLITGLGGLILGGLILGQASCGGAGEPVSDKSAHGPQSEPSLPVLAGRFAPAHTIVEQDAAIHGKHLTGVDNCDTCHPDVAAQWESSAHAFASFNNPVYRVSINGFRDDVSKPASRFCAGCHDVSLMVDGAMEKDIEPRDGRGHAGITCRICHGISEVRADGNGSYTLGAKPLPLPRPDSEESIEKHRRAASRSALGNRLCLACHRSFLGPDTGNEHHLIGMDDYTDWQNSAHAGQGRGRIDEGVKKRDCIACHMTREPAVMDDAAAKDGTVVSHRFMGGHTWLAAMRGDEEQLARVQKFLRGVVSIDIAAAITRTDQGDMRALPADGAAVAPGSEMWFDVVVRNLDVGHRFPGGVRDAQGAWIEVVVRDARGQVVAESGVEYGQARTAAEIAAPGDMDGHLDAKGAHVLRSLAANRDGEVLFERQVHRFGAGIMDHTILPRDAIVVRYGLDVPADIAQPLAVEARLMHRTRNLSLQARACEESRTARGQEFGQGSNEARGVVLDPCVAQPITEIAGSRIWVGEGWRERAAGEGRTDQGVAPAWRRLYEHGMGWAHAVQERLDEARPSLQAALAALDADDTDSDEHRRHRAMVMVALGRVAGRQGRTDEALKWLDRAEALAPGFAAVDTLRGAALMRVWRWQEAEAPLLRAAGSVPDNVGAWVDLAVTLGSLGKDLPALQAAQRGLALNPRSGALLRVQALALRALGGARTTEALDAYDRFRAPDQAMEIRFACAARSPACARERQPVHEHRLQRPVSNQ